MTKQREKPAIAVRLKMLRWHYGIKTNRPGLTMGQFAADLGIVDVGYRRLERGLHEPSLDVLARCKRLTGISLDWLICNESPGDTLPEAPSPRTSVAQRLTWARQMLEPFAPSCAAIMGINNAQWQRYENGRNVLPVEVARQFAHRFSVDLDYLYSGQMDGIAPLMRDALLERHPELRGIRVETADVRLVFNESALSANNQPPLEELAPTSMSGAPADHGAEEDGSLPAAIAATGTDTAMDDGKSFQPKKSDASRPLRSGSARRS